MPEQSRFEAPAPIPKPKPNPITALPQPAAWALEAPPAHNPVLFEPQLESVQLPAPIEAGFGKVSTTRDELAITTVQEGVFGTVRKYGAVAPTRAQYEATGFEQLTASGGQRSAMLVRGAGFATTRTERGLPQSIVVEATDFGAIERQTARTVDPDKTATRDIVDQRVRILWKPSPRYSDEALAQRIEGEVVLLVRFLADGTVETLQLVRGLGYGLDRHALEAAEAIRFEPATRSGQPIDYIARVRIRFELAY